MLKEDISECFTFIEVCSVYMYELVIENGNDVASDSTMISRLISDTP